MPAKGSTYDFLGLLLVLQRAKGPRLTKFSRITELDVHTRPYDPS